MEAAKAKLVPKLLKTKTAAAPAKKKEPTMGVAAEPPAAKATSKVPPKKDLAKPASPAPPKAAADAPATPATNITPLKAAPASTKTEAAADAPAKPATKTTSAKATPASSKSEAAGDTPAKPSVKSVPPKAEPAGAKTDLAKAQPPKAVAEKAPKTMVQTEPASGKAASPVPGPKATSPAPKAASPAPKAASPAPKAASPAPKAASPVPKAPLRKLSAPPSKTSLFPAKKGQSAFGQLLDAVSAECGRLGIWGEELQRDLPKKWEKHGDLVLLPPDSFGHLLWRVHGRSLWAVVAKAMNAQRLARKKRLHHSDHRHTYVELLYGPHGWVQHTDNGITYNYDIMKCLYRTEGALERARLAGLPLGTDVVVDLFAGIGYTTLSLLKGGAKHVYAIDWDPEVLDALRRNLAENQVEDRCTVLEGDCRKLVPVGQCDRVVLGLLPSSRAYLLAACKALRPSGGWLHLHDTLPAAAAGPRRKLSAPALSTDPASLQPNQLPAPKAALQRQATAPADPAPGKLQSPEPAPAPKSPKAKAKAKTLAPPDGKASRSPSPKAKKAATKKTAKVSDDAKTPAADEAKPKVKKADAKTKTAESAGDAKVADKPDAKRQTGAAKIKAKTPPRMSVVAEEEEEGGVDVKSPLKIKVPSSSKLGAKSPAKSLSKSSSASPAKSPRPKAKSSGTGSGSSGSSGSGSPGDEGREGNDGDSGIETEASADSGEAEARPRRKLSRSASIMAEMLSRQALEPVVEAAWKAPPELSADLCREWSLESARRVTGYLDNLHDELQWTVVVARLATVSQYSDNLHHVVLDLLCKPSPLP